MSDFWVFGYGSLMWRPGFAHVDAVAARLAGAHRALCIYSWVHRGTRDKPGLVLGLDQGGSCLGVAFRVASGRRAGTLAYLRERELVTDVYREVTRRVSLADGRAVEAIAYVVRRHHAQYAGHLPRPTLLALTRDAVGQSGRNADYVVQTQRHLAERGIHDATLAWLARELASGGQGQV